MSEGAAGFSPMGMLAGAAGSILGAGISLLTGGKQKRQGRALINQKYPEYGIPSEVTQAAAEGLPSEQYAQAMKNINRNQVAAMGSAQSRRAGVGMIGKVQQGTNDATGDLDVANAKARQQNQLRLGEYKDKKWKLNVKDKYDRDYNYGMQLLGAGNVNSTGGMDKLGAGLGMGAIAGAGAFKGGGGYDFKQGFKYADTGWKPPVLNRSTNTF